MATHAATVYKCINDDGKTEFSQKPCDTESERVHVTNPRGGIGISSERKEAQKKITESINSDRKKSQKKAKRRAKKRDCYPIQSTKLRRLIIERKLAKCMTKANVRKVFERGPNSIRYASNGGETWYYRLSTKTRTYVYFNADGLVTSWTGSR